MSVTFYFLSISYIFLIFTYTTLFVCIGCNLLLEYRLLDTQYNMHQAQRQCSKQFNGFLPTVYKNHINNENLSNVWAGMKKITYKISHWVDSCTESEFFLQVRY